MSSYLGYDPDLVDQLHLAMRRALDELDAMRCSEHEAEVAMRRISTARGVLRDVWLPVVAGLRACRAMTGYVPTDVPAGDVISSWIAAIATQRHWAIVTDPLAALAPDGLTIVQVQALAATLCGAGGEESMTTEEVAWLAAAMDEIARRPELVAAFMPAMTTTGWVNLCDQLAAARQRLVRDALLYDGSVSATEAAGWTSIDAVFAGLGATLAANHLVHPHGQPAVLLDQMSPMAAALVVRSLGLGADDLAAVTRSIVERERPVLAQHASLGPWAGDVLFETMLATVGAPAAYVMLCVDDPGLVLGATDDPLLGHQLAVSGTDPQAMAPCDAAAAVPAIIRWILGASTQHAALVHDGRMAVGLAEVIGPYLLEVMRTSDDAFDLSDRERSGVGALIIGDAAALARLVDLRTRVAAQIGEPLPTERTARLAAVRDLADVLAIIDTMQRARAIRTAEAEIAEWELMWSWIGTGADLIPVPDSATEAPSGAAAAVRFVLEAAGWGPRSLADARSGSLGDFDTMTTVAASMLVATSFDHMVASGRIPPAVPPPPAPDPDSDHISADYALAFDEWLARSGLADDAAYELDAIKQAMSSHHEATTTATTQLLGTA